MKRRILFCLILLSLCLVTADGPGATSQTVLGGPGAAILPFGKDLPLGVVADMQFGRMPLYFIPNQGQLDSRVFYYVQGQDKTLYFGSEGLTFILREPMDPDEGSRRWVLKHDFIGARPGLVPEGLEETGTVISYFKGPREQWKTGLPTYFKVAYREVWPGIDLIYSGHSHELKHEFVVKPGANASLIRLGYRGAESVRVNDAGELEIANPVAGFKDAKPVAWQDVDGRRSEVSLAYQIEPSSPEGKAQGSVVYGFQVGNYDPARSLILDPASLVYCGYIGGSGSDDGRGVAVDTSGNAYVTGSTASDETTFPETVGPDLTYGGSRDAFVAKVSSDGTGLVYCGYIGGGGSDYGYDIAVDGSGNAYIAGVTLSSETTFPVTVGPDLTFNGGTYDAYVAKVRSDGTGLAYCGYIGGSGYDLGFGVALDGSGNAYVTGYTQSTEATFPETVGPDLTHNGGRDAFVAKVSADGAGLTYCGYIGGSSNEEGNGIAVDGSGNAYIIGDTSSAETTFPVIDGPDLTYNGNTDAFVAKVGSAGAGLVYCGYIGGSSSDYGEGIAVDGVGNAYVTGWTYSNQGTFDVIVGPDATHNGSSDAFVVKVFPEGTGFGYSGFIGGEDADTGLDIALDGSGNAYVAGYTSSDETTFPVSRGPDLAHNGWVDGYVAKVRYDGTGLNYCGYIGGVSEDYGQAIAVDGSGNAFVAGETSSDESTFPDAAGPDLTFNGSSDIFVAKVSSPEADLSVSKSADNLYPVEGDRVNFTVTVSNSGPDNATGVEVEDHIPAGLGFISASATQGTYSAASGLWTVGTVTVSGSAILTLRVKVNIKGTITNTATVARLYEADPNSANDTASVTISSQYRVYPPLNFQLARLENNLIFFKEYVNRLTWQPNPQNQEVIVNYRLYRKAKNEPVSAFVLHEELDASVTIFYDRGLKRDERFSYRITAVSSAGIESQPVEVEN